jgi:CheY-like chemotaxis protein
MMAEYGRRSVRRVEAASLIERIAEEVREPVRSTLAVADQLRRMRLPEGAATYLDTISEASAAVLDLLETASDLQSAELGRFTLAPEPRRLQDLMDDVEGRWRGRAENAGVTLLVSYDGDPECAALVDCPRLLQVFDALIGHALAHVRHGVIEASLKTQASDDGVGISGRVRDNGARYTGEYLAHLFDAGGAGNDEAGGMAVRLGLALASRTLQAMGGRVSAKPNVGAGATMTFDATLRAGGVGEAEAAPSLTEAARSAHILVVDDNATNRMVVEALCEMFDCSTESVVDGIEAVEAAKGGRFDVILMDIKMPRMDGVTATREIRKLKGPGGRVPIIALTANADPDEVNEYLQAGMHAVVEKPIKPERLMEALDAVLTAAANAAPGKDAAAA